MTTVEGGARASVTVRRDDRRPGSVASRLAESSQQLAIVLEELDLEEQPEFGEAVVEAVDAVDEAAALASRSSDDHQAEPSNDWSFGGGR